MSNVLCVTGMHRSGTSLVACWLESSGLPIHDGRLFGPDLGNPRGHFEDLDFISLQSDAIKSQITQSHGWKVFSAKALGFQKESLERAKRLAEERNRKFDRWGWKDPRTVLFLEQWKELIPQLKMILIWRPCGETAHSLVKRSRAARQAGGKNLEELPVIGMADSVKLWVSYNQILCRYKERYSDDTILLPLSYIVYHDEEVIKLINDKLKIDLSYKPIAQVFDPNLLHGCSFRATRWAIKSYELLYGSSKVENRLSHLSDRG